MAGKQGGKGRGIVIRREEIVEGGHHGGAWKVAYADFVTAMMAFFLLMWLLNATTEEQRRGLADYFTPTNVLSQGSSGNGRIFGGRTPYERGEMVSDRGAKSVVPGQAEQLNDQDDPEFDRAPNASTRGAAEDQRRPEGREPDPGGGQGTRATEQAGRRAPRASASRCFCPTDKFNPFSRMSVCRPEGSVAKTLENPANSIARFISSVSVITSMVILNSMVFSKISGSCGMSVVIDCNGSRLSNEVLSIISLT